MAKKLIKNKIFWIVIVLIIIAVVLFIKFSANAKETFKRTVQTANVTKSDISKSISATGTLSNSGSTNIEIPSGIKIKEVLVSSGETVKKDQKLASIDKNTASEVLLEINEKIISLEKAIDKLSSSDSNYSLKKTVYNNQLTKLKELLSSVEKISEQGYICATESGVINNISENNESNSSSTSNSNANTESNSKSDSSKKTSTSATKMNYVTSSDNTSKTSNNTNVDSLNLITLGTSSTASNIKTIESILFDLKDSFSVKEGKAPECPIQETSEYSVSTDYKNISSLKAGADYTIVIKLTARDTYSFAKASNYTISIDGTKTNIELIGKENEAKNILQITLTGKVASNSDKNDNNTNKSTKDNTSKTNNNTPKKDENSKTNNTNKAKINNDNTNNNSTLKNNTINKNDISKNNKSDANTKNNTNIPNSTGNLKNKNGNNSSFIMPNNSNTNSGSVSTTNMSTDSSNSVNLSSYSVDMNTPFTLASSSNVTITVSVDELDINSVAKDQKADITIDAIENGKYEGKVTKVSSNSTNSNGGNAKYNVDITLEKNDKMKQGMSASVTIKISEASDCLSLPVNAVIEEGDKSYVYTKDSGDGNLTGKQEIETGLSDGSNVEIKSGLSEGDTVYYTKIESSNRNSKNNSQGGFPGGSGGFPGSGSGRSGGFPGSGSSKSGGFPGGNGGFPSRNGGGR